MIISCSVTFRIRAVLDRISRENQKAFCSLIFSPENRAVYEIMWKNVVRPVLATDDMAHALCMLGN
jgi:hypothetical protein